MAWDIRSHVVVSGRYMVDLQGQRISKLFVRQYQYHLLLTMEGVGQPEVSLPSLCQSSVYVTSQHVTRACISKNQSKTGVEKGLGMIL